MVRSRSWGSRVWARRHGTVAVRVGMGCAIAAGVCLSQLNSPSGADTSFNNGTASAGATAAILLSSVGQLNASIILGTSDAAYENEEGQALAQTLDLGLVGDVLEADNCMTGGPGTFTSKDFPAPAQAESTNGNQTVTSTAATSLNGTTAGVGVEVATATTQPSGSSTTTIASDNLAGLVNIGGATSSAQANVENDATRVAGATADIKSLSLANGLVQLKGLHWSASQTSGASSSSTAAFMIGSLSIAGVNIPISNATLTSETTTLLQIVNTALGPTGMNVQWPVVTTLANGEIQVSPLVVGIDNSALSQEIVGANLGTIQPVRDALTKELFGLDCNFPGYVEVADVELSVAEGGGDFAVELGGANANTADVTESSPFGLGTLASPPTGISLGIGPLPSTTPSIGSLGLPSGSGIGSTTLPTPTIPTVGSGGAQKVSLGPVEKTVSCRSIGTAGGSCNTSNVALPVGLIGLVLLGGLAVWDYVRQRRRTRLAGLEA